MYVSLAPSCALLARGWGEDGGEMGVLMSDSDGDDGGCGKCAVEDGC